jgi:hypothetical protein
MTDTTKITLGIVGGVAVLAVLYLALRPATPTLLNDGSGFSQDTPLTQQETSDGSVVGGIARVVGDITRTIVGQVENDRARAERETERREAAEGIGYWASILIFLRAISNFCAIDYRFTLRFNSRTFF